MIYLDHAASSPMHDNVLKVLNDSLSDDFANPSSSHRLGRVLYERIESSRESILRSVGAEKNFRLIFTSSATESNNTAIYGFRNGTENRILFSAADHPSVVNPIKKTEYGLKAELFPLKNGGIIDLGLPGLNYGYVKIAVLTFVNNQSGTINDIKSASDKLKKMFPDILIHVDAVQGFGKFPIFLDEWNVDSIAVSSHKIGGPKGIAGLFIKKKVKITPLMYGGGQEMGLRPSTQAAPLIFGFSEAVKSVTEDIGSDFKKISELNRFSRKLLKQKVKELIFPFPEEISSPYILTFIVPGIPSDMTLRYLEREAIFISSSSACSSKSKNFNESFSALSIPEKYHNSVLRISFSVNSTEEEIEIFSSKFENIYKKLKKIVNG